MEEPIHFTSDSLTIEGLLSKGGLSKGIVVTHPHPLMGGDMNNMVVDTIVNACIEKGYTTLRFNFRGTGRSEGAYGDGEGEKRDVLSAVSYLNTMGVSNVDLYGYSFGSWVNSLVFETPGEFQSDMVMVSPPVDYIDFNPGTHIPKLKLVITGSLDAFASPKSIETLLPGWNEDVDFEVIQGADHFYFGYMDQLKEILQDYM